LTGKWLELLKEVAPRVKRVAFIFNPKLAPGSGSYYTRLIEAAAPSFAVTPTVAPIHGAAEIERAIGEYLSASQTAVSLSCRMLRPWLIAS
jgi:putative tryptophan/tyrosine transport system substrate-binding protein